MYDCIIVGGGIAGLQAAIQLGRYTHKVLVIDANHGRSTLCRSYHNLLGWPNGVSGQELRDIGQKQAEELGIEFINNLVESVERIEQGFRLAVKQGVHYTAKRLLLATGVLDRFPALPKLLPCLGISLYICPDCDGYEVKNKRTIVLGSGNIGAQLVLTLTYWTQELIYINHEQAEVDEQLLDQLQVQQITYINEPIQEILAEEANLQGFILQSGKKILAHHGFLAFGGNEVRSALAKQLGVELLENKHILVDPRTKQTNIRHVWAAGDVVAHSEQVVIAMGDGSQAAIWIHKSLMDENE